MANRMIEKIISFLFEAVKEGMRITPSEHEITNWMGKEAYNKIVAREGKKKATEIFYLTKQGKIDPSEYAGIKKPVFRDIRPKDWRDWEDDC